MTAIDWTQPIELDTNPPRPARVVSGPNNIHEFYVKADWKNDGSPYELWCLRDGRVSGIVERPRVRNVAKPAAAPATPWATITGIAEATGHDANTVKAIAEALGHTVEPAADALTLALRELVRNWCAKGIDDVHVDKSMTMEIARAATERALAIVREVRGESKLTLPHGWYGACERIEAMIEGRA